MSPIIIHASHSLTAHPTLMLLLHLDVLCHCDHHDLTPELPSPLTPFTTKPNSSLTHSLSHTHKGWSYIVIRDANASLKSVKTIIITKISLSSIAQAYASQCKCTHHKFRDHLVWPLNQLRAATNQMTTNCSAPCQEPLKIHWKKRREKNGATKM
jgi:hypothetical protein